MIAYNSEWLDHLTFRKEINDALEDDLISQEEYDNISRKYPVGFYTPNIFIRKGLFLLTVFILLLSFALLALLSLGDVENRLSTLAIFFAIACFVALEFMISSKDHYHSGVDDGLLWFGAIILFCGISLPHDLKELINCLIIFCISSVCSVRYADRIMSTVAYISFLGILFFLCVEIGTTAKAIAPFIIMIISFISYLTTKKLKPNNTFRFYKDCLELIEIISLISLYAAGNYYVVRELSIIMFNLNLQPHDNIAFGWLFWIFTIFIPIIYLGIGIQKKDIILLRVGLILFAAIVFTVRYYHTILPIEMMLTIGGIMLLLIAYGLTKWLQRPVFGYTSRQIDSKKTNALHIESLIIAETFKPGASEDTTKFGGGNFGGGGASGDF